MSYQVSDSVYQGIKSVVIEFASYQAVVLPEVGGNLISFIDTEKGYRFLREPKSEELEAFKARPSTYGIPVLFPPNRYEDGKFTVAGKSYEFPITEERTHNHLHGFFFNRPWEVTGKGASESESFVVLSQQVDEQHEAYQWFPHTFTIQIRYSLSSAGLQQKVSVINRGNEPMPCMIGFHTAVNAPFAPGSTMADCSFTLTIGERWELSDRMLPTEQFQSLTEDEQKMKSTGASPFFAKLDNHYTADPQNGFNGMVLTDSREKVRFIYDAGLKYKQWMVWNFDANSGFFCPEPQTNAVNAPNLSLPAEKTGLVVLQPGETWEETSRMYTEPLK